MAYTVVILSKFQDILSTFLRSIHLQERNLPRVIVVTNGDVTPFQCIPCEVIRTEDPFCYAKSANIGISAAGGDDVFLCNDDIKILQSRSLEKLASLAQSHAKVGLASPIIDGGVGNQMQSVFHLKRWPSASGNGSKHKARVVAIGGMDPVCFICVYLKREAIQAVGPLDEKFVQYGFEDNDYCLRLRKAGFLTVVTRDVMVKHGTGGVELKRGENWSQSFARVEAKQTSMGNYEYYLQKWATPPKIA